MRSFVRNIESAARYKSQLRIEQMAGKAEPKTQYIYSRLIGYDRIRSPVHANSAQCVIEIHRYATRGLK